MRALLQRVDWARVRAGGELAGEIGPGLLVLLGCERGDDTRRAARMARRVAGYRVFPDPAGRTNLDVLATGGEILLVSQFTLVADTRKGLRPSFDPALEPVAARVLVEEVASQLRARGIRVAEGIFGAAMVVELANHGPASYLLEVP